VWDGDAVDGRRDAERKDKGGVFGLGIIRITREGRRASVYVWVIRAELSLGLDNVIWDKGLAVRKDGRDGDAFLL
jgi:hypothetical protein